MIRSTFKRTEYVRPPRAPLTKGRRVSMGPVTPVVAACPKHDYIRSPALLAAVRTLPCMHTGVTGRTEPAHSNWAEHGKGRGIKADDNRVAALCAEVHRELDQGKNWTREQRREIWWRAHCRTVAELLARGLWPMDVPIPDTRNFN